MKSATAETFLEKFDKRFRDYRLDQLKEMSEKLYTSIEELYTGGKPVPMNIFEMGRFAMDTFLMRSSFATACIKIMEGIHGNELEEMGYLKFFKGRAP